MTSRAVPLLSSRPTYISASDSSSLLSDISHDKRVYSLGGRTREKSSEESVPSSIRISLSLSRCDLSTNMTRSAVLATSSSLISHGYRKDNHLAFRGDDESRSAKSTFALLVDVSTVTTEFCPSPREISDCLSRLLPVRSATSVPDDGRGATRAFHNGSRNSIIESLGKDGRATKERGALNGKSTAGRKIKAFRTRAYSIGNCRRP